MASEKASCKGLHAASREIAVRNKNTDFGALSIISLHLDHTNVRVTMIMARRS
jgi:hypothetical protein